MTAVVHRDSKRTAGLDQKLSGLQAQSLRARKSREQLLAKIKRAESKRPSRSLFGTSTLRVSACARKTLQLLILSSAPTIQSPRVRCRSPVYPFSCVFPVNDHLFVTRTPSNANIDNSACVPSVLGASSSKNTLIHSIHNLIYIFSTPKRISMHYIRRQTIPL